MREIIFRGKRTDNGEWVEGYLTRRPSAIQYETHYSPWYIDKPPRDPDDNGDFYNVDPETIGQFTGLIDADGKRVFEGDILKNKEGFVYFGKHIAEVVFDEGRFCGLGDYPFEPSDFHRCEIIGNIHDNPELLNEREDTK